MTPRQAAADLIRRVLADGAVVAGDVERAADAEGVSVRTLRRAADGIGVVRTRDSRTTWWALPASQTAGGGQVGTAPAPVTAPTAVSAGSPPAVVGAAPSDPGTTPDDTEETEMIDDETADDGARYVRAVETGLTWPGIGRVLRAGDVVELPRPGTDEWQATTDRHGSSFLDDLSDAAQVRRWGVVHLIEYAGSSAGGTGSALREPITPAGVPSGPGAYPVPKGEREGSRPLVAGLGGDGPVTVVVDRAGG